MSLADFPTLVDDLVRDTDQVITSTARDTAIEKALQRYSIDAPRRIVEDVTVNAQGNLPLPTAWHEGQSVLEQAEYPIGERPRTLIAANDIEVVVTPSGTSLVLLGVIASGEQVRLTYTGLHVVDALTSTNTVPLRHRQAVAALAAADLCGQLAAYYANEGAPTIGADTVDHQGKSERWRARARDLIQEYSRVVGPAPAERAKPASVDVAVSRTDSLGRRRMFHPASGGNYG